MIALDSDQLRDRSESRLRATTGHPTIKPHHATCRPSWRLAVQARARLTGP